MRKTKALGQHFLMHRALIEKILSVISPQPDELIIEIGAGKGALTFPLAERCHKLIAIEKDRALIPLLLEKKKENIIVLEKDVLRLDFADLLRDQEVPPGRVKLVGNLPYSISSPFLFKVLDARDFFRAFVFLLQKEVAERLSAQPGSKKYAPLSILFQLDYEVRLHMILKPGAFSPPPRVESALISLKKRERPLYPIEDRRGFRSFLRLAFSQRRKTLVNNLKSYAAPLPRVIQILSYLGLPPEVRPEQVSVENFGRLFDRLSSLLSSNYPPAQS